MGVEMLERAVAAAVPVIDAVRPEQMSLSSPCASWTVGALVAHIAGAQQMFVTALGGPDVTGPDIEPAAAFHAAATASVAAFGQDGALERTLSMPMGEVPATMVLNLAATDVFVHAWDVAKATGQPTDLDPALAEELLAVVRQMLTPQFRGPDGQAAFGFEQTAPDGASAADRLAAFTGRAL
jgi:uncharacterized protein (TIGR03086 family)